MSSRWISLATDILGATMVKELTSEKKAKKQAVYQAISSLGQRGEASNRKVGDSGLLSCRSNTLLDLVHKVRTRRQSTNQQNNLAAAQMMQRMREMEAYNQTLRQRVVEMQAQLHKLRGEKTNPLEASLHEELQNLQTVNADLRQQIARLKEEVQSATKSVNIAWQQGYLAGQLAVQEQSSAPQKGFIETLAEAAQAATAYGAAADTAGSTSTATATEAETPPPAEEAYVVECPDYLVEALQLNDPEVLNDPFTAKLLGALGTEVPHEGENEQLEYEAEPEHEPVVTPPPAEPVTKPIAGAAAFSCEPDGMMVEETQHVNWYMNGNAEKLSNQNAAAEPQLETVVDNHAQEMLLRAQEEQKEAAQEATKSEPQAAGAHDEQGDSQFNADELHNLFRNKYVRNDEPAEKPLPVDPSVSGTFPSYKKFVGTNKTSSEPLPTAPRVFPPDIRKACKLLGVNPEELTKPAVTEAWKKEMAKPGVHPDTGGDTEMAIYLNTAKDTLMRWLDDQAPKLGKKFGSAAGTREQQKPKKE